MAWENTFMTGDADRIMAALKSETGEGLDSPGVVAQKAVIYGDLFVDRGDYFISALKTVVPLNFSKFEKIAERDIDLGPDREGSACIFKISVVEKLAGLTTEQQGQVAAEWKKRSKEKTKADRASDRRLLVIFAALLAIPTFLYFGAGPFYGILFGVPCFFATFIGILTFWRDFFPHDRERVPINDLLDFLNELQQVCRVAVQNKTPVIYYFYL